MNPSRIRRNIDPFDATDYITWKIRIRADLKELQLIKVMDVEVPENKTIEWIKNNNQAVNEIMDYLANSHIGYISGEYPIAKEILKKLDDTHNRKSQGTQMAIKGKLLNLKLQNNITLKEHFHNF